MIDIGASLAAQTVKNLPTMQETWVQSLGWEDSLEEGTATHSSILAWRILWAEEPGGLPSIGSQSRTRLTRLCVHTCMGQEDPLYKEMATHFSILARKKSHEQRTLVGYCQWGRKALNTTEQPSIAQHNLKLSYGTEISVCFGGVKVIVIYQFLLSRAEMTDGMLSHSFLSR